MGLYQILKGVLPYLNTLLNIHVCRTEPCMSLEDEKELRKLIAQILEWLKDYERTRETESDF